MCQPSFPHEDRALLLTQKSGIIKLYVRLFSAKERRFFFMRITMICIGSTGDVRPYIILGRELRRRGHDIAICAFSDFESDILAEGLRFKPADGDVKNLMGHLMTGDTGLGFLKHVHEALGDCLDPFLASIEAACDDAEAIIANYFGQIFRSIAEVRHVPYIQTHYFPMDKNDISAISSAPMQNGSKAWKRISYPIGHLLVSAVEKLFLADWRKSRGMPPRRWEAEPNYQLNGHTIPVLYAVSPLVMPRPVTWAENIHMTGYWLGGEEPFTPSQELTEFLERGEKPVYIGFGSMVNEDMDHTLDIVLQALEKSGTRAVMSTGWGGMEIPNRDDIFVADFVPHHWLFRQVSAVVHHGGAGTTAAGLQAGKPTLIIPFGGDQPIWAQRVQALGVGPKAIARDKLTVEKLSCALTDLTSTKKYRVAARELGERLEKENGALIAANIIEYELRKWLEEEGREPVIL